MVAEYNGQHRHRSLPKRPDGKHMTPDEAWAAKFDASLQHKPTPGELRELFMPAVLRTAKRGQVTLWNQDYQAPELMRRDVDGREVSVRYDIHDPMWVRIYSLDGHFICDAQWQANRIDFMPKAVVQIAREKRVAATVKRREQQIDIALRELGDTVQPAPFLPEPSAPFVVVPSIPEVSPPSPPSSSGVEVAQAASGRLFLRFARRALRVAHGPPRRLGRGRQALGAGLRRQRRLRGLGRLLRGARPWMATRSPAGF